MAARSKPTHVALALLLTATLCMAAQAQAPELKGRVTLLVSPGVRGAPNATHLAGILEQSLAALHIDSARAPNLVFLYADPHSAQVQHVPASAKIMVARMAQQPAPVWHVWILTDPSDGAAFQGVVMALNQEFDLKMSPDAIAAVREQMANRSRSTISVADLLRRK